MFRRFEGKVVLITGAARGIGLATAEEFSGEGALVIATDCDEAALRDARDIIGRRGKVETHVQDVTDEARWTTLLGEVVTTHGRFDVLVNNAGIGCFSSIEDTSLEDWRRTIAINLDAVFLGTRAAVSVMREKGGVIVNLASIESIIGDPLLPAYNASKGGVEQLTKSAALWCAQARYPVRVVSMHPGFCNTPMVGNALASLAPGQAEQLGTAIGAKIPMGRLATPREIARPILFLASDDASYMTGSGLVIDGGYTAA